MYAAIGVLLAVCAALGTMLHASVFRFCVVQLPVEVGRLLLPGLTPGVAWLAGTLALSVALIGGGWMLIRRR